MSYKIIFVLFFTSLLSYGQSGNLGSENEPYHVGGNRYVLPPIDIPITPTRPGEPLSPGTMKPDTDNPDKPRKGELKWKDGSVYSGVIKNGKPNGEGTLRYSNGAVYEGAFTNGKRNGQGKIRFPDNAGKITIYEGEWSNDVWNGTGTISNDRYEISGNVFSDGNITGQNARVSEIGEKGYYEGGIKDGKLHGIGTVYNAANNVSGEYLYVNGTIVGIVLSENSTNGLNKIKRIANSAKMGKKILAAYAAFVGFNVIDDAPENISLETLKNKTIVTLFNSNELTKDTSGNSEDFFTLIAIGIREIETIKSNEIKETVREQLGRAKVENNKAEREFWEQFKNRLRRKSTRRRGF